MLDNDVWKARALPSNVPTTVPGMPMSDAARLIALTASPSETPARS